MMSDHPTPDEVRASIVPKSDQLNADDLVTGPITVTITGVRKGDKDQPIIVEIEGHQPYKPCKTCRRVLIATYGDDPKAWVGQRMTLYCDPEVMWGGVKIGGIRISHLSGLDTPRTFMLTHSRGKRSEVTIRPLAAIVELTDEDRTFIAEAQAEIAGAESMETLKAYAEILKRKSKGVQDALRPVYKQRMEELKA
ncbi:MAG: hypothetical protein WCY09_08455 [Candidatus Omnitrophota bacterium]